jgi:hypothetical protein
MFNKEPAAFAGVLSAASVLIVSYGLMTQEEVGMWAGLVLALIPLIQGFWTRDKVVPVDTIKEAGLTPEVIKERAEDPSIPRALELK